jgi:hypothetical protein
MNSVEIEEAISNLAEQPFDKAEFPFLFLEAFGNKPTTITRLRKEKGGTNKSKIGGVLQTNNIHIKTCADGDVSQTLNELKSDIATAKHKAKFILATDGHMLEAEDLKTGNIIACDYSDFPDKFAFFLPLAGITTIPQIIESAFDIKATRKLNKLYMQLLLDNPDWGSAARRPDMNHFMARLIFCFFAEDTEIFQGENAFTSVIELMSDRDASNTHDIISTLFAAMNTAPDKRGAAKLPRWATNLPYVNGGLFNGSTETPKLSKPARAILLNVGADDWQKINPDIFGSMIQAVADDEERGALGMHYTSVPNILKVLNPLFLDDLRGALDTANNNTPKLKALRDRISKVRVFDPACGSGNFLVIAYKELRKIEVDLNTRLGTPDARTAIRLRNFRGIEINDFPAEIARLALIIAEYQCDVLYRGQREALVDFLPLDSQNWITCGNALQIDWIDLWPSTGTVVKLRSEDLFSTPLEQAQIDFEAVGGETYICGNPPYLGSTWQSGEQKADLKGIFDGRSKSWKSLDYVAGWFMKAADYGMHTNAAAAFVSTNSINQGQQVPILWPLIFQTGHEISFAHTSFKWANLASYNAGVTVVIVGISNHAGKTRRLFSIAGDGGAVVKGATNVNAYLVAADNVIVNKAAKPLCDVAEMSFGNKPVDGGHLLLTKTELDALNLTSEQQAQFIRRIYGSAEFIRGVSRYVLWIKDDDLKDSMQIEPIRKRIDGVRKMRLASRDKGANAMAATAHQMREMNIGERQTIAMPCVSSENRGYLPVGLLDDQSTVTNLAFALYDAPLWNMALIASRIHLVWIATVCGKLKTDFRYSNTLGWNTFPVPKLTANNKADLTRAAENILLAREAHFPATIADLYKPNAMPENLRLAHQHNDETLERIYIGRRFKNDTERLEKLFEMYTKMTTTVMN